MNPMETDDYQCGVEGCNYGEDMCGLSKLRSIDDEIAAWDAGEPLQRMCRASQLAEMFIAELADRIEEMT